MAKRKKWSHYITGVQHIIPDGLVEGRLFPNGKFATYAVDAVWIVGRTKAECRRRALRMRELLQQFEDECKAQEVRRG